MGRSAGAETPLPGWMQVAPTFVPISFQAVP